MDAANLDPITYWQKVQVCPSLILQQISLTLYRDNNSPRFAYSSGHCLLILFYWAETEIHKIKDDSKIKREKNIDRRGQRHIVNGWHLSDSPSFSLLTTVKEACSGFLLVTCDS
jgi:hypothetical protein